MTTDDLILRAQARVRTSDADAGNRLSPAALARYLQDAAADSAEALGFGFSAMLEHGHTWVLVGLRMLLARRPAYDARFVVATWPRELDRLQAKREFLVTDSGGAEIARASSTWLVMDVSTRRPVRPEAYLDRPWHPERVLDRDPSTITPITGGDSETSTAVRWGDLDMNGHLNNTHFLDLILENFDQDWLLQRNLREVEMTFLAEGRRGDTIVSRRQSEDDHAFRHSLTRAGDGKEIFRARTVWD